jgi:hypothetical protein
VGSKTNPIQIGRDNLPPVFSKFVSKHMPSGVMDGMEYPSPRKHMTKSDDNTRTKIRETQAVTEKPTEDTRRLRPSIEPHRDTCTNKPRKEQEEAKAPPWTVTD